MQQFIVFVYATRKCTAFLRHGVKCLLHFPQNVIYFIILSFSVQIKLIFFTKHALKFILQPGYLKINGNQRNSNKWYGH